MKLKSIILFVCLPLISIAIWAQTRIIPHVTSTTGGFNTKIILENSTDASKTVTLTPYDQTGHAVNAKLQVLSANTTRSFSVVELFGAGISVSHFTINGDDIAVNVVYQASAGSGSPAHLRETDQISRRWRLFPGDWSLIFDGFAVVNLGGQVTGVTVGQYDYNDHLIKSIAAIASLAPNQKGLYVIGAPVGSTFTPRQDTYFEISASEDLAITALRGTPPGAAIGYLWANSASALEARPEPPGNLSKWEKWNRPSYFRGYDVVYWCEESDCVQTLENFQALKSFGANLAQIQNTEGTVFPAAPYSPDPSGQQGMDDMVNYCRQVEIDYVIAIRVGPGRIDVAEDGESDSPVSTIWTNTHEQQLYAQMLVDIVSRYQSWDDPLFVGINVMVEPNPLWGLYETPEELRQVSLERGVDINAMNTLFINAIRTVDPYLPILVQSTSFSNPEYWGLLEKQNDPYIIYDHHTYVPYDYSHYETENGATYPGSYWSDTNETMETFNKAFMRDVVLQKVRDFQTTHNVPVFMGEFGMMLPQNGGVQYLTDLYEISTEYGWHFALWAFRTDNSPTFNNFNYEEWDSAYWSAVLSFLAGAGSEK